MANEIAEEDKGLIARNRTTQSVSDVSIFPFLQSWKEGLAGLKVGLRFFSY